MTAPSPSHGAGPESAVTNPADAGPGGRLLARFARAPRRFLAITAAIVAGYGLTVSTTFGLRPEHVLVMVLVMGAVLWSDGTRDFLRGVYPLFLLGIAFDTMRLLMPLLRYLTVHVSEPYNFDKTLFGITTAQGTITPNEYFAQHHWPWVDFVTGTAYILYLYVALALYFYLAFTGRRDETRRGLLRSFGWGFLLLNLMGMATYYLYPAAPPWYVAAHGFGPVDLATPPNPAATIRWDELTGINYFRGFYARGSSVFGAIPSLHAGYPLLTFFYLRKLGRTGLSIATFMFFLLVCFSAVYLQHHYILDVTVGAAYACIAYVVERVVSSRLSGGGKAGAATAGNGSAAMAGPM